MNKGYRLTTEAKIGIVAPASFASAAKIDAAKTTLQKLGHDIQLGDSCRSQWHSYSGTDSVRAADINQFFQDPTIKAIICLRGGYGSLRLLDQLDYKLIAENPKIFVGYSDITAIHLMLNQLSQLITFHGPMLTSNMAIDFDPITQTAFFNSVSKGYQPFSLANPNDQPLTVLFDGTCEGTIIGGNLITLVSTLGTPYEPNLSGKILFIEEINEPTYKIDRALTQLWLAGKLQTLKGIIIGDFHNCLPAAAEDMSLIEVFQERFQVLKIPVIANLKSGHCQPMITLPLGATARIDTATLTVEIIESVVL